MDKYFLILLMILSFTSSCKSLPQSEPIVQNEIAMPKPSGDIVSISIKDDKLTIQSDSEVSITFAMDYYKNRLKLEKADYYRSKYIKRPDGPINELILESGEDMIAWIGTGIREQGGFEKLSVYPSEGVDSIILKSEEKEWVIPRETETVVNWGDGDYIAYASNISKGKMADQPAFRCNLILLKN